MLPNLIVIGAMKSGTSSLHNYLDLHPQIFMSATKELDFFVLEKNWPEGIEWYESHFVCTDETRVAGESSPNYTTCHSYGGVPGRMHAVVPDAKLIYVLRDPIERIVSHYVHNYRHRKENRKISEVLKDLETNYYVLCSRYYMQLEQFLAYFPPSSILITTLEDLVRSRRETLQKVFRFLDVDDSFHSEGFSEVRYRSGDKTRMSRVGLLLSRMQGKRIIKSFVPFPSYAARVYRSLISGHPVQKPVLSETLKQDLVDVLQDDVNKLREYTENDFADWCL